MRNKGYSINHKTVLKLMNKLGLKGKQCKNDKYHSYNGKAGKVANNLLKRNFYAAKPFEKLPMANTRNVRWIICKTSCQCNANTSFRSGLAVPTCRILKVEMFYGEKFESANTFIDELKCYIDHYNNEKISSKLKGMSPVKYRTHSQTI